MQHTPGPWRVSTTDPCLVVTGKHGLHIAQVASAGMPNCEENARLIALAPQLLDALQRITHPMADDADLDHAIALIEQATGVQP